MATLPMSCAICFDNIERTFSQCPSSSICQTCFVSYLENEIIQGKIHPDGSLKCYCASECSNDISPDEIMTILLSDQAKSAVLIEKYHEFHQNVQVATDSKKLWCVSPSCVGIATIQKDYKYKAQCQTCQLIFCSLCNQQHVSYLFPLCWGGNQSDSDHELQKWKSSQKGNCRKCPNCHSMIEKNGGCNHMTCRNCKYEFCWACKSYYEDHCTGGLICPLVQLNKHDIWGTTPITRAVTKSVAYPILAVCTAGVVGVGMGIGTIGAVTVMPFYGLKKVVDSVKERERSAKRRQRLMIIRQDIADREAKFESSHFYNHFSSG
jgi:hypothetical protein